MTPTFSRDAAKAALDAGETFLSIASPEDRVASVHSFPKSWAMTGWRLGWIVTPPALMDGLAKLSECNVSSAPTFVQHAGVVALDHGDDVIAETRAGHRAWHAVRRAGYRGARPDGAMYLFLRVDGCTDSVAVATSLLTSAGVGLAPGAAFGDGGERHLRVRFAQSDDRLRVACTRVAQVLTDRAARG